MRARLGSAVTAVRSAGLATRRLGARAPLRVRLVATLMLLVTAALIGCGAVATATMRSYLVGRVDDQLRSVAEHPVHDEGQGQPGGIDDGGTGDGDPGDGNRPLPSNYVIELTNARGIVVYGPTSNLVDHAQPLPLLPHPTAADSRAAGTHTFTVPPRAGDEQWRVLAKPVTLADGTPGTLLVAQSLGDVQNTVNRLIVLLLVIGAAAVVVLAGVGYLIVRASLRPLGAVEATAAKIAAGDLTRRVPESDPRTEVGQLAGALNTMLAEIESAFTAREASEASALRSERRMRVSESAAKRSEERMRRFVADASHELRTPLTSIRGFAELYRQGAATDVADVRRLMARIEDEATRMGLLVEDLLLLARLDEERPLARLPVDLLALAGDAVHDAQAVEPDRPIRLEVGSTEPPPIVTGDEARLRQVLANLLSNARKHTPAATAVTVRVSTGPSAHGHDPVAILLVSDRGPGMAPQDAARAFERFYRADPARSHAEGSTGLGLAIVSAIVAGHAGTVDIDTGADAGTSLRIELPLWDSERTPRSAES